jgi:hypothetical protein
MHAGFLFGFARYIYSGADLLYIRGQLPLWILKNKAFGL